MIFSDMEKAKKNKKKLACLCVPARSGCRSEDLIKKCAVGERLGGLTVDPHSPQVRLSCLTLIEPRFSESPALMENKFCWIRMEPLTSPFSGPETFICFKTHTLISVLLGARASFYLRWDLSLPLSPQACTQLSCPRQGWAAGTGEMGQGTGYGKSHGLHSSPRAPHHGLHSSARGKGFGTTLSCGVNSWPTPNPCSLPELTFWSEQLILSMNRERQLV